MAPADAAATNVESFTEKGFYLAEFRGRTLALAGLAEDLRAAPILEAVLEDLAANATRVVLISSEASAFECLPDIPVVAAEAPRLEGAVWSALRSAARVGVCVQEPEAFAAASGRIALRLGVTKLVWLDAAGALLDGAGRKLSFVDLEELRALLRAGSPGSEAARRAMLVEIEALLSAGLPAVNLCTLPGLADELFTYSGSGTLFSRERYVEVRSLGIDDFDAAEHLIRRGVEEGYLAPRSTDAVEQVLTNGFGAFVEGRHLAGIGALLRHEEAQVGEIASLYTLTRFLGEGIGAYLLEFACERACAAGCGSVFAVTTSDRVVGFFERNGFRRVSPEAIPETKWRDYDSERRTRASCLLRNLEG